MTSDKMQKPLENTAKNTNEKPVSLHRLTMDEAVTEFLQVKPPPKDTIGKPKKSKKGQTP